ncbi:glutamate--putrescine ligase [Ketogulonicigenium robustum]|uniref:Glutamate--putrescine ligase n=1 Tax=Ketogulonicigenium robustum TaxID=92947 RepID=A0A1W6NXD5_9RHOB|nr:glutamine synthetase family protein [Ketogulonicigenium robustum]ARO13902.1 glutamate--putrescine ligase [Ketogulonicigenium robustum]
MSWLDDNLHIKSIRTAAVDLNGQARGKRTPTRFARRIEEAGIRFPISALNLDIWGEDVEDSPLVFEEGDPDGLLRPTDRGYVPMPWLDGTSAMLPMWMYMDDGQPYGGDPRHALKSILDRYTERGLRPVVATEMEFYLVDDSGADLRVPPSPRSGKRRIGAENLSLRVLDAFDNFFNDLYDACEAMDIPAEAAMSEVGPGQFEINLQHVPDALRAADNAWLFKTLTRGLARKHKMAASFMAKPYPDFAGNGLHVHFSLINDKGRNVFANDTHDGTKVLYRAIAGCLQAIPDCALIFAPHHNSYERLVPESHAPTGICWAHDNRTASIRVPASEFQARRIEHRVAGGDVNPYLLLTAILGAALIGLEDDLRPPPAIEGSAYGQKMPQIPVSWEDSIDAFAHSDLVKRIFPAPLIDNLVRTKRQEMHYMAELSPAERLNLYLDTV